MSAGRYIRITALLFQFLSPLLPFRSLPLPLIPRPGISLRWENDQPSSRSQHIYSSPPFPTL